MKMQNKLLPCPFCGGEAFVDTHKFWDEKAKDFTVVTYGCACHQCGAKSWQHSRTEEEAIKHWNTRKPMERIMEQLEDKKVEYLEGFRIHKEDELYGIACGFGDAINIVKGGVDNAG
jgi:Lar family restriction alleviation protein